MFVPHSGNVFVGSDFGSQEPRILSHVSKEPILMNNFVKELDVYSTLVSSAYKLPYDQCTKDTPSGKILRNKGKILLLALSYGMQAKSLSQQLGVSLEEAQQVFNNFRDELHVAFDYGDRVRRQCKVNGYVKTLWGRKRRFPAYQLPEYEVVGEVPPQTKKEIIKRIRNANWQQRYDLMRELEMRYSCAIIDNGREIRKHETEIVNSIIQGSAADMVKVALIKIFEDELMNEWGAKLVFQVHD